jgi:hypothetical protein
MNAANKHKKKREKMNTQTETETPQLYWSELAELTHISQVETFGWCSCEDGDKVYEDCTQDGQYPENPKHKTAKDYTLNTYANGFGIWHADILFSSPMGNTGEAERIISNAITNAKRQIRQAIQERQASKVKRLSYEIAANNQTATNQLTLIRIREK